MSIPRINFTSADTKLLNKIQSNTVSTPVNTEPKPTEVVSEEAEPQEKSHKVRNWSIGLGAAATLVGLGVLGRSGKLGEGVQRLLGGVKKNVTDLSDELETRLDDIADDILSGGERRAGSAADDVVTTTEHCVGSVADDVVTTTEHRAGSAADDVVTTTEHRAGSAADDVVTGAEQAVERKFPPMPKSAEDVTEEYIAKVNSAIDRTIPKIDENLMHSEIPDIKPLIDDICSIDTSKFTTKQMNITLPNGNTRSISLSIDNQLSSIFEYDLSGKKVLYASFANGKLSQIHRGNEMFGFIGGKFDSYTKKIGNTEYTYDLSGKLTSLGEFDSTGKLGRHLYIDSETNEIKWIYYRGEEGCAIKRDSFVDGRVVEEEFYNPDYKTLKTISH